MTKCFGMKNEWLVYMNNRTHITAERLDINNKLDELKSFIEDDPERGEYIKYHIRMSTSIFSEWNIVKKG